MILTGELTPRLVPRPRRSVDAVTFARERLGFTPNEQQAAVMRSRAKRVILNCSRQWGKSTVTAARALFRAKAREGCLVLAASPSQRQSAEWMRKAKKMAAHMGIATHGDGDNEVSLRLDNGSRIVGLPGVEDTTRGFSAVSMLVIDEAARVSDEMFTSLMPMLAVSDGDIWMMSTPRGKSGFFYDTWEYGGPEWLRVRGPATECAQIRGTFLEEQRRTMTADRFRQEYLCEFVGQGARWFERELVEAMLDDEVEAIEF
jgi:hypothetical protein